MILLDPEVRTALSTDSTILAILGGAFIYQPDQPNKQNKPFNAIIFEDISNVPAFNADDQEMASRITYQVDVYCKTDIGPLLNAVERVMSGLGFCRHSTVPGGAIGGGQRHKTILFITVREC